jgi:PleD family two-component response regulator
MPFAALERPRVLVVAGAEQFAALRTLFGLEPLAGWDMLTAGTFEHAHHLLQHVPFDLLLVSHDLLGRDGQHGLARLASQFAAPVLFLGADQASQYAHAYEMGASACLPWRLVIDHPLLLDMVMRQTAQAASAKQAHERTRSQLAESHRRIDRLLQMIWRLTPRDGDHWYSQRHVLERLQEEIVRCQRHGAPLSIAVGEICGSEAEADSSLPDWASEAIVRGKRRSDIVGAYGNSGFLLLMVHTRMQGGVICCRRLQDALEDSARRVNGPYSLMRSFFGIASMDCRQCTPQMLLRIAELDLESARHETIARG